MSWEPAHDGNEGTVWAFTADRRLAGQVAYYDVVNGGDPGWVGYRNGHRVTGRCATAELAQHLVSEREETPPTSLEVGGAATRW